jgi:predicted phage baseplate assembly protein
MPLVAPDLDSRTFEQLVTEVRKRIPSLTPEWTDLNESDPGVTLAQLFAFMSEQLLFQINQVPDKGLITFLRMVGAELHPATPAVADVTLTNTDLSNTTPMLPIDAATQISTTAPPPGEKIPISFETVAAFSLLNGSMVDLVSCDCDGSFRSLRAANDALPSTFRPFDDALTGREAVFFVFELNDPAALWPEGTFRMRVNLAGSEDVGDPPVAASPGDPRIEWAYSSGSVVGPGGDVVPTFATIEPSIESTMDFTRSGYVAMTFDDEGVFRKVPAAAFPDAFQNRFVLRASLRRPDPFDGEAPVLQTVRLNTIPVRNLTTVTDEALGASSGLPFQRYRLANAPVFPGSVRITADEAAAGGAAREYEEVADLFAAGPNDRVFQLIPATGLVLFGNGEFGKIPPPDDGSSPAGNITATRYQFGGGLAGNVGAETIARVTSADVPVVLDATNVLPARGGDEEEPVELGVARAPAVVRSRFRAVSAGDFEALARQTPDVRVARAKTLPNTRPGCTPGLSTGAVTVVLVPNAQFERTLRQPIPVQPHVAAAVLRYLDERRLVTTQVFTASATFRRVEADVTMRVEAGASLARTRAAAIERLYRYFHALVGGEDGRGWPFGGAIQFSRVFEQLLDVPGIDVVEELTIGLDGAEPIACEDVPIGIGELLVSGEHRVRVRIDT